MSKKSIKEYFKAIYERYHKASKEIKRQILDEFCANTGYNRKYAIRKINGPPPGTFSYRRRHQRRYIYGTKVVSILTAVWKAAGYPCSVR